LYSRVQKWASAYASALRGDPVGSSLGAGWRANGRRPLDAVTSLWRPLCAAIGDALDGQFAIAIVTERKRGASRVACEHCARQLEFGACGRASDR
jgi:hypothetical protein